MKGWLGSLLLGQGIQPSNATELPDLRGSTPSVMAFNLEVGISRKVSL